MKKGLRKEEDRQFGQQQGQQLKEGKRISRLERLNERLMAHLKRSSNWDV